MKAAYVTMAGLDGMAWLACTDPIQSLVTIAVAEEVYRVRAEAFEQAQR